MNIISQILHSKTAPGILLCLSALVALIFANTPLVWLYDGFQNVPVVFQVGGFVIDKPLLLWINDGLMAIFFLHVGLEIKREMFAGHLSSRDKAALPAIAALGGLSVPALIYAYINWDDAIAINGWAIPAATDIAFALGILLMLGSRVPTSLKVCLVAIAIIDDLAAIVIIAFFYTADISIVSLSLAGLGLAIAGFMNWRRVTRIGPYVIVGLFIWACVLKSGVHATLSGVALGFLIPLNATNKNGKSPLKIMEHALHPWVSFGVIPIFAFANAGVSFAGTTLQTFLQPVTLGIMLGLFLGKQIGVIAITWFACTLKIARLPDHVTWPQYYGMALLTGIGFTMSLFIGTLAFTDPSLVTPVRLGVLSGSMLSAIAGISVLFLTTGKAASEGDKLQNETTSR
jgi:Na+:H+ antiporter, NhaA family